MRRILTILFLVISVYAFADIYHVSPRGDDANTGADSSSTGAWETWQKAFNEATPGDTVYFMGGTWTPSIYNVPRHDPNSGYGSQGKADSLICFFAYPGKTPVRDCRNIRAQYGNTSIGIQLSQSSYLHFKGIEIKNLFSNGQTGSVAYAINGNQIINMTFEEMVIHQISGKAYFTLSGAWEAWENLDGEGQPSTPPFGDVTDTMRWINCDVYELMDTFNYTPGNTSDGWWCGGYHRGYFSWEGCRAWNYSDDGIDSFGSQERVINNCWLMSSKKFSGFEYTEGNGIKLAGCFYDPIPSDHRVVITNTVALYNASYGIVTNLYAGVNNNYQQNAIVYNNTAYRNEKYGFRDFGRYDDFPPIGPRSSIFRNNIAIYNTGTGGELEISAPSVYTESNNTWDAPAGGSPSWPGYVMTDTVTITDADFVETDSSALVAIFTAARQGGGSLPETRPLTLATGSDMINAGTIPFPSDSLNQATLDIINAYNGVAPDIGATKYSAVVDADSVVVTATGAATTITVNNGTLQMIATVYPDTASQSVTWSIANGTGVGTINQSGLVTAVSDGTATVKATTNDGTNLDSTDVLTFSNQNDNTVPTVVTSVTSGTTSISTICGGNVTATGGAAVTERGICWNTSTNPTTANSSLAIGSGTGVYSDTTYALANNTLYYFRAYATNSEGTAYGDNRQATTLPGVIAPYQVGGKTINILGKTIKITR